MSRKCVYTERRSRNRIVLVVVLVLDWVSGLDYEDEDENEDDEKKFARRAKILRDSSTKVDPIIPSPVLRTPSPHPMGRGTG